MKEQPNRGVVSRGTQTPLQASSTEQQINSATKETSTSLSFPTQHKDQTKVTPLVPSPSAEQRTRSGSQHPPSESTSSPTQSTRHSASDAHPIQAQTCSGIPVPTPHYPSGNPEQANGSDLQPAGSADNKQTQSPAPTAQLLQYDPRHWRALISPNKNVWASSAEFGDVLEMVCFSGPGSDAPVVKKNDLPNPSDLDPLLVRNTDVPWEMNFHTEWGNIFHWRAAGWVYDTIDWDAFREMRQAVRPFGEKTSDLTAPLPLQIISGDDFSVKVRHPHGLPHDTPIMRYDAGPDAPYLIKPHGMECLHPFGDRWYFAPELDPYYVPRHLWGLGVYNQQADGTPKTRN